MGNYFVVTEPCLIDTTFVSCVVASSGLRYESRHISGVRTGCLVVAVKMLTSDWYFMD